MKYKCNAVASWRMSSIIRTLYLVGVITLVCGNICPEDVLERTIRNYIKRNYGSAAMRELQLTELDSNNIQLFYSCSSYHDTGELESAVVSFNIAEDAGGNGDEEGVTGRLDITCYRRFWSIKRSNRTPLLMTQQSPCYGCEFGAPDPCKECDIVCLPTQEASSDCTKCVFSQVTKIHTLSPPWTISRKDARTDKPTTIMMGTSMVVATYSDKKTSQDITEDKKTEDNGPTELVASAEIPIITAAATTEGNNITTQTVLPTTVSTHHTTVAVTTPAADVTTQDSTIRPEPTILSLNITTEGFMDTTATVGTTGEKASTEPHVNITTDTTAGVPSTLLYLTPVVTDAATDEATEAATDAATDAATEAATDEATEAATDEATEAATTTEGDIPNVKTVRPDEKTESPKDDTGNDDENETSNDTDDKNEIEPEDPTGHLNNNNICTANMCQNGGRGICDHGAHAYCACPSAFTGEFCEEHSNLAKIDGNHHGTFFNWKISKYIIGGLAFLGFVGIILLISMTVKCMRTPKSKDGQPEYYGGGVQPMLPPPHVVVPMQDLSSPSSSTRGSSDVIDEKSEEEFHLHSDDDDVSMATSSDQIQVHRPHYKDHDDGLLHHAPSHSVPSRGKNRNYMNLNGGTHTMPAPQKNNISDCYAQLDRSYSAEPRHNYLNLP